MKKPKDTSSQPKSVADDRAYADESRRDDAQPDAPQKPVGRDEKSIGAQRLPRKGDDDLSP